MTFFWQLSYEDQDLRHQFERQVWGETAPHFGRIISNNCASGGHGLRHQLGEQVRDRLSNASARWCSSMITRVAARASANKLEGKYAARLTSAPVRLSSSLIARVAVKATVNAWLSKFGGKYGVNFGQRFDLILLPSDRKERRSIILASCQVETCFARAISGLRAAIVVHCMDVGQDISDDLTAQVGRQIW